MYVYLDYGDELQDELLQNRAKTENEISKEWSRLSTAIKNHAIFNREQQCDLQIRIAYALDDLYEETKG